MVLMTTSMDKKPENEEAPTGELRKDAEGKGYWHSFKNDKKVETVETPIGEIPLEDTTEVSDEEEEPEKPVATKISKKSRRK